MSFVTTLTFVKKNHETDDIYTFSFSTDQPHTYKAGQHGLFVLPGLYRPHPFSLSSSPDEPTITFSTHTATGSAFKNKLMRLKAGQKMFLFGPIMNFTFAEATPKHVFLAQGIGITPFRSMLVHAHTAKLPLKTTLIHVDSKAHAFKSTTQEHATTALYPSSSDEFRRIVEQQSADQVFYISGSPRFVSSTKRLLNEMHVPHASIKTDSFLGY